MAKRLLLLASHLLAALAGFGAGIYLLPILTAPPAPDAVQLATHAAAARYHGEFRRDLAGSDLLHWGEGRVMVSPHAVVLDGRLAPGPDYKLYLSPGFVATEAEFLQLRPRMVRIGDVRSFDNFVVAVPPTVNIDDYDTVIVWCEAFSQFITAARYR